jgi:archaellum component FlaC
MDNLKSLLESQDLANINRELYQFIHSAEGYENRLKKVFALMYLIAEADNALRAVGMDGFISDIRERVNSIDLQTVKDTAEYHGQLAQNDIIARLLTNPSDNNIEDIRRQISTLLNEYDAAIKLLVELREKMTIEQQIAAENINGTHA